MVTSRDVVGSVGDQQARPAREPDGADNALAHAAAHLVWVLDHPFGGRGDSDQIEAFPDFLPYLPAGRSLVQPDRFRHLFADGEDGIEGTT